MIIEKIDVEHINKNISENCQEYVLKCENNYKNQIFEATKNIINNENIKFVLLAGPSSSGKTTTSKILMQRLEENGLKALPLSLDDFFVERVETPKWEDGTYNFETVEAIDWNLFSKCMEELLEGKPCFLPTYDFVTGTKSFSKIPTVLHKNSIVIIEGLHALNPVIDNFIPTKKSYKLYISVNTSIFDDGNLILDNKEVRLFRRMIRDMYSRSTTISQTLEVWNKVLTGEKLYIDPFVETADYKINSFHAYEIGIYKHILTNLGKKDSDLSMELKKLSKFVSLGFDNIPKDSVLQEFAPKNC